MKDRYPFLLCGRWQETSDVVDVINPYNNKRVAQVCRPRAEHAEKAMEGAAKAEKVMAALPSHKKADILLAVSQNLLEKKEEVARIITLESGKPIQDSRGEVERAALTFRIASEEASRMTGEYIPLDRNRLSEGRWGITRRFPCGTVFGISPFNFPLNLVAHKIAPAIASGNPIILKPASKTPVSALVLAEIIMDAGLPDGCLSILPCDSKTAEMMIADSRIKVFSFTGSVSVGWHLKQRAYNKRVLLELGGNAGVVVDDDCDLEYAVRRCVTGGFSYAGQVCISVQRVYVHKKVYEAFLAGFVPAVKELVTGDPLDDSVNLGPMIDEENALRVESWVREAQEQGARIATGGKRSGTFYEPTVIVDTTPQMKVSCMEVFAPVVTVTRVASFREGIAAMNDSSYGLQSGVFTNNLNHAFTAFEALEVGGIIINDVPSYRVDHMPYGGVKLSGFGREGVRYAIEEMTELRLMAIQFVSRDS